MKRGLVIGKFLPLHEGHLALIRFAASRCDELIVSMSYKPSDPIDPGLRFSWLNDVFWEEKRIKPEMVLDDFDDESLPISDRTKIWAAFIRRRYPRIDALFSSEEYGEPFADQLGVPHEVFDIARERYPVSATLIRQRPFTYWDFLPAVVKPYFVKKVCFYGPESTGKSVMAKKMADEFHTECVPEVAREMISSNDFTVEDIIRIGHEQTKRVLDKTKTANKLLICDTDLITTEIYSSHYLNEVPSILLELEKKVKYDLYLLFDIDVPWIGDGLRDLGSSREQMYNKFKRALEDRDIAFEVVRGGYEERERLVRAHLQRLLD